MEGFEAELSGGPLVGRNDTSPYEKSTNAVILCLC